MLEAWKKGEKIQVTRRKIGGGTERVLAEFQSVVGNGRQLWCLIDGRRVRVSISGATSHLPKEEQKEPEADHPIMEMAKEAAADHSPAPEEVKEPLKEAPADSEPAGDVSAFADAVEKAEAEIGANSGAKVETTVAPKSQKPKSIPAPAIKKVGNTPGKTDRVVFLIAKGKEREEIKRLVNCDNSLINDCILFIKLMNENTLPLATIAKRARRSERIVVKFYNAYLSAKAE